MAKVPKGSVKKKAAVPRQPFFLHRAILVIFNHEIRAQNDIRLHRESNPAMKNKSLRRITAVQSGKCFAPRAARQEHRGVPEVSLLSGTSVVHSGIVGKPRASRSSFPELSS